MPRSYPSDEVARLKAQVVAQVAAGQAIVAVAAGLGVGRRLVNNWAERDPVFRLDLENAKRAGHFRRLKQLDEEKMQAILARMRAGEGVHDLWGKPGMPSRSTYFHWKAHHPHFAEQLRAIRRDQMAALGARGAARRRDYDPELADTIYARLWIRGTMDLALAGDPRMPSETVVARWRREQPEFDRRIRTVISGWRRQRPKRQWLYSEEIRNQVMEHVAYGGSLESAGREPDLPSAHTLCRWMRKIPDFAKAIWQAYDDRDEAEIVDLIGPDGGPGPKGVARQRLRRRLANPKIRPGMKREE